MRYYIITGEASGELHGSLLMKGLLRGDADAQIRFWGGDKMAAVGGEKARDYRETAVMGLVEVLSKAGSVRRNLAFCKADILSWKPDVVILIDYPGFNLKIARFAHEHSINVFYYIAPKVWASREKRVEKLRSYVDRLFVIFPFEVEYFRSKGIEPVYEGNPLLDCVDATLAAAPPRAEFFAACGLEDRPTVALLAGSRMQEIKFLAPRMIAFAKLLASRQDAPQLALAAAPGIDREVYERYFGGSGIKVVYDRTYPLLKYSDFAVVASGTASLETALIGTPQVVCYGMNPITCLIARMIMKVKYISLANLILDKWIFNELLQERCTAENIAAEMDRLMAGGADRSAMLADYSRLREALGSGGAADRFAARMIELCGD